MKPDRIWDGKYNFFKLRIIGESDSDYANCPFTRCSVSGFDNFLGGAPATVKIPMHKVVALSVIEAKIIAAVFCAQDVLHIMSMLNSLGLFG